MLAQFTPVLPKGREWCFEPKYDGMRILAVGSSVVRLLTRDGNDKARQFPEVVAAVEALRAAVGMDFVLDSELVALLSDGYAGFQTLLGRVNLDHAFRIRLRAQSRPASLVAFDLLALGLQPLVGLPFAQRRQRLTNLLAGRTNTALRLARQARNGERLLAYAVRRNLEGLVAKRLDGLYRAGARSNLWLKYKLTRRQEFVVAGYTESDRREHFRALVLGYYAGDRLVYAGTVGSGFSEKTLEECYALVANLGPAFCPFAAVPRVRGPVQWVRPEAVVEVKFAQWSDSGVLYTPRFAGLRTDKRARDVVREDDPA